MPGAPGSVAVPVAAELREHVLDEQVAQFPAAGRAREDQGAVDAGLVEDQERAGAPASE